MYQLKPHIIMLFTLLFVFLSISFLTFICLSITEHHDKEMQNTLQRYLLAKDPTAIEWIDAEQFQSHQKDAAKGFDISKTLTNIEKGLTDSERQDAWTNSNYFKANNQTNPVALFILGPGASGKSHAVKNKFFVGSHEKIDRTDDTERPYNAVVVDGETAR
eukprot:396497_1